MEKQELTWSPWYPLNHKSIWDECSSIGGVYRIRKSDNPFGRLRGSSDILYIGRVKGLRGRLQQILIPGAPHIAEPRVRKLRNLGIPLEFSFHTTRLHVELEKELLAEYEREHLELPPLNHSVGKLKSD